MSEESTSVTILGAGAWGTALAQHLALGGRRVTLWGRDQAILKAIRDERENSVYLPEVVLSSSILVQDDLVAAVAAGEIVVLAVPCAAMRSVSEAMASSLGDRQQGVVWTCKGFEPPNGRLMHEVLDETLGDTIPTACLSGPSFATEVAVGQPTAVALVSRAPHFAQQAARVFHAGDFRVYPGDDLIGVEVVGAIKNVVAIAAGISEGLGYGMNARAALIARGLAEIGRLVDAVGGRRETLMGLAGVGDVVLTCTDNQSRNRRFGLALVSDAEPVKDRHTVEGVMTARVTEALAQRHGVELPICSAVAEIIDGRAEAKQVVERLLRRKMKSGA